ncbi:hypothetical protein F2P56_026733 [Juglans regia]|uniref:Uncharacterized protein LOC109002056 n=2 Tax=Juglans regia TaxID=51240 RepID=A0A2I4FU59_JUGRE|nr:uncharacterized protein LOC109002056 [Juglans regia]KAF5451643.1 hypothetical protein F2P56_026733 [Juglans regia]
MRIRKNAKLSSLWFSSSHALAPESLQTHVCQLNQSPWDAISFGPDTSHQFDGEDSFTGNASLGDSVGAEESVASMMNAVAAKAEYMVVDDNDIVDHSEERSRSWNEFGSEKLRLGGRSSCCQKTDGKGWQCRNEAKEGQSFCDHHLSLLRSYNNTIGSLRRVPAEAAAVAGAPRARGRAGKKGSSSNPYEFYYYSGFGPLWGRKRGDRRSGGNKRNMEAAKLVDNNGAATNITTATTTAQRDHQNTPSSSQFDNGGDFDYMDEEDDDDHEDEDAAANNDSGKKRMRKPVKARSLKSLM